MTTLAACHDVAPTTHRHLYILLNGAGTKLTTADENNPRHDREAPPDRWNADNVQALLRAVSAEHDLLLANPESQEVLVRLAHDSCWSRQAVVWGAYSQDTGDVTTRTIGDSSVAGLVYILSGSFFDSFLRPDGQAWLTRMHAGWTAALRLVAGIKTKPNVMLPGRLYDALDVIQHNGAFTGVVLIEDSQEFSDSQVLQPRVAAYFGMDSN